MLPAIGGHLHPSGWLALVIFDPGAENHGGDDAGDPAREPEYKGQDDGTATLVIDRGGGKEDANEGAQEAHGDFSFHLPK